MKATILESHAVEGLAADNPSCLPRLDRILVATDFSEPSLKGIEVAASLLQGDANQTITLVHVIHPMPAFSMVDLGMPPAINLDRIVESTASELTRIGRKFGRGSKIASKVLIGCPSHAIVELAEAENFDLIVMSSHGRSGIPRIFLGSVAEGVINNAGCSVLIVKNPKRRNGHSVRRAPLQRWRKIIVGYDERTGAADAVGMAERVAERTGARITLVNALDPESPEDMEEKRAAAVDQLSNAKVSHKALSGKCPFEVKIGPPWEVLSEAADELPADLVVVGPHEHLHRALQFTGSTAQRLIRLAHCSVLAVK